MSTDKGKYISLSQGKTYYEIHSNDKGEGEWVVCVHGITWWSFCFNAMVPVLVANGYRVLVYDLYGRGLSDAPNVIYDLNLFVVQLHELLENLGISRASLIGTSFGGLVSAAFCVKYPEKVDRLTLVGPAGLPLNVPFMAKLIMMPVIGSAIYNWFGKKTMLERVRTRGIVDDFAFPDKLPKELVTDIINKTLWIIEEKHGFLHAFHSTLCNGEVNDGMKYYQQLPKTLPVLLIWGEQDAMIPSAHGNMLLSVLGKGKLEIIPNCGHSAVIECAEKCNDLILEHLRLKTD